MDRLTVRLEGFAPEKRLVSKGMNRFDETFDFRSSFVGYNYLGLVDFCAYFLQPTVKESTASASM